MIEDIEELLINGNFQFQWKIVQDIESIKGEVNLPRYPVIILTCMDPRIDVHRIFQLNIGDVFVLRNAGNKFTEDVLRSILIAIYKYNIRNIVVLGHLDCGMTKIKLLELKKKIPQALLPRVKRESLNLFSEIKDFFKIFIDELRNVKEQIKILQKLQVYKPDLNITGMLYDTETGWVFEYKKFKEFAFIENFRRQFNPLVKEKQNEFIDYLDTSEEKIVRKDEIKIQISDTDSDSSETDQFREIVKIEKEKMVEIDVNEKPSMNGKIQSLNSFHQTLSIKIPKILFPGIKIYIPEIFRRKKENLVES